MLATGSEGAAMDKGRAHEEVGDVLGCRSGEQGKAYWEVLPVSGPLQTHLCKSEFPSRKTGSLKL